MYLEIDRSRSATRISEDIEALATEPFTSSRTAICRYAYTNEYARTLRFFREAFEQLAFTCYEDPVGNFVASNREPGEEVFGLGSHCDSNRNGGKFDGTLGVAVALEVCRLSEEFSLNIPLRIIAFMEEESSGFGQGLLGSRIATHKISESDLRALKALDDGRSFFEHAEEAGYEPERWRECRQILQDLSGWIEVHIEQGRILQEEHRSIGVVDRIAGYQFGDVHITGRSDHAGATPMELRSDAGLAAAEIMLYIERLAHESGGHLKGTVGEVELHPGIVNVVAGTARMSIDIRGLSQESFQNAILEIDRFAKEAAGARGASAQMVPRHDPLPVTPLDPTLIGALSTAAASGGIDYMVMPSGGAHDTMCLADVMPAAMVFVPCKDGLSHTPKEHADAMDAALAAETVLNAILALEG